MQYARFVGTKLIFCQFFGAWTLSLLIHLKLISKLHVIFRFCSMRWFCSYHALLYNGNTSIVLCSESLHGPWFWRCKLPGTSALSRNLFSLHHAKWKMRRGILELPCEKSVNCLSEIRLIICVLLSAELGLSSVAEAGPPLINYWNVIGGGTQDIWSVVAITFSGARMWLLMGYITLDVGFVRWCYWH